MTTDEKPKGPASYFPSIEQKYGRPISHWLDLVREAKDMKHMEIVNWLKTAHQMGHGHANAIVAHALSKARTPAPPTAATSATTTERPAELTG